MATVNAGEAKTQLSRLPARKHAELPHGLTNDGQTNVLSSPSH